MGDPPNVTIELPNVTIELPNITKELPNVTIEPPNATIEAIHTFLSSLVSAIWRSGIYSEPSTIGVTACDGVFTIL